MKAEKHLWLGVLADAAASIRGANSRQRELDLRWMRERSFEPCGFGWVCECAEVSPDEIEAAWESAARDGNGVSA